jgi:hypothetical protein
MALLVNPYHWTPDDLLVLQESFHLACLDYFLLQEEVAAAVAAQGVVGL